MLNLTISHVIHLPREERYALHDGRTIVTEGVSVPVWLIDGTTSEPAREVFCRYILRNTKEERPIQILDDGYDITIPYREGQRHVLNDEDWLELSMKNPDALFNYYARRVTEVSSKNLLDPEDGGGKCLMFREQNKVEIKKREVNVVHYIKIDDMEELLSSIY